MSKLENIISYAKEQFEFHKDSELVSVEAEVLLALFRSKGYARSGVIATTIVTNEFNLNREAHERWKTIQVGRVMARLGLRPKRSSDGRAGWLFDKVLLNKLLKRYNVTESMVQGKMV